MIFALVCAYAHAQCCEGTFTTIDGKDPVQPKDEVACKAAPTQPGWQGIWKAACATGTSCVTMQCTGKQGTTALKAISPMCSTAALQTGLVDTWQKTLTTGGVTEVKCASATPSSKFASGALLMVSAFVSLVVSSV